MAKTYHEPETGTPTAKSRHYTVGYIRDLIKHLPLSSIVIEGQCMAEFGFSTGQKIEVFP